MWFSIFVRSQDVGTGATWNIPMVTVLPHPSHQISHHHTVTSSGHKFSAEEMVFQQRRPDNKQLPSEAFWKIILSGASKSCTADGKSVSLLTDNTLKTVLCNLKFTSSVDRNKSTIRTF
jgi:hypothetical protein